MDIQRAASPATATLNNHNPELEEDEDEDGIDITRKLPEELISQILSSMPTKSAVRTSVLSSRWRYLWTSVTNLDIDAEGRRFRSDPELSSFIDFVDRVFRLCSSSPIQLFRLKCNGRRDLKESVERWICEAIKRNPTEIIIHFYNHTFHPIIMPLSLFTCKTLTTLKLIGFLWEGEIPSYVDLPNLKVVTVGLIEEGLLQILIDRCPLLEDLYLGLIKAIRYVLEIRSPRLKKLMRFSGYDLRRNFKIVLHAPNLEYLDISTDLNFDIQNLKSLLEASLWLDDYNSYSYSYSDPDGRTGRDQLVKVLKGISGVKSLSLHFTTQYYKEAESVLAGVKLPTFPNLVSLMMVFTRYSNCKFLPQFLESSPNLKVLSLHNKLSNKFTWYEENSFDGNFESGCSLLNLEQINLQWFGRKWNKDDHAVLDYLLRNAVVLKELKVVVARLTIKQEKRLYKLVKLKQAAARDYRIEFLGDHLHLSSYSETN